MVRHIVMFRVKEGTTPEVRRAIIEELRQLPSRIPQVRHLQVGEDLHMVDDNADLVALVDFASREDYLAYRDHPVHRAFVRDILGPHLARRMAVQYAAVPGGSL